MNVVNVVNVVDWIAIIFFGSAMILIALAVFFVIAVMSGNSQDSYY